MAYTDQQLVGRIDGLRERIGLLEQQVAVLAEAAGVSLPSAPPPDPLDEEVRALLQSGGEMKAIKLARKERGLSLQDASHYVSQIKGSLEP